MDYTDKFKKLINNVRDIVITTHLHPDADGIGSQAALCMALNTIGIKALCVNEEPLLERYNYLDPNGVIIGHDQFQNDYKAKEIDLLIVVDTNSKLRIGPKMHQLAEDAQKVLFIDHHPCKKEISDEHIIDTTKAATGELIGTLLDSLDIKYTEELALPLYTSILIDTSSFRYPTVTADTHRMIAKLLDTGVTPPYAYNKINGTKRLNHMRLLGTTLSSTQMTEDAKIAWLTITHENLDKFDIDPEDTHSYVNHLLILDHLEVACMFKEERENVKVSFRSSGKVDVGKIATKLGGGGHNHSAATVINGSLDKIIPDTIAHIKEELKKYNF